MVSDKPQLGGIPRIPPPDRILINEELLSKAERLTKGNVCQVYRINNTTVVKTGDGIRMAEATTMHFIKEKTSVPVPKVLDSYVDTDTGHVCIIMEYIDGKPLDEEWDSYSDLQKRSVESQLKQYFDEIRQIPGTFVGSIDGSNCNDQLFDNDPTLSGPFDSEAAFQTGLIAAIKERGSQTWTDVVIRFIEAMPAHKIVFAHNDIAPRNILVRDAKVVGIVDWEFSGFYPEYWDYVKAFCWPDWQSSWIKEGVVDRILEPYLLELAYILHARDIIWGF
ncbi:hypothetical protein P7C71_g4604, partial [Lecanoromycetidae sp. Uapishka_2]